MRGNKSKTEIADVPGLGSVVATINYQVQADGTEQNRSLGDARYNDGSRRPVENEHRQRVGQIFRAYV